MKNIEIISFKSDYKNQLGEFMQKLNDHIVELDSDSGDLLKADVSDHIEPTIDSFENHELLIYLAIDSEFDELVGYILGRIRRQNDSGSSIERLGSIGQLFVTPKYQGQGIGKSLLNRIEHEFCLFGSSHIQVGAFANNLKAINFYSRLGFEKRLITMLKEI